MTGPSRSAVVTGSSGLLGGPVVRSLRALGMDVRGIDLRPSDTTDVVGDLTRPGAWQDVAAAADLVVHTAALVGERGPAASFWSVNVGGTSNVLSAATGRVVHVSSIVVHGRDFPDGVDEAGPVRPTGNPYTDTKIASEHLALLAAAGGRPVAVVRPGDVYGPGSQGWTVRPVQMLRAGRIAVPSRGVLSPVYVDDVVEGIVAAATTDAALGQVVHLSGGVGVSPRDFFGRYAGMLGRRLPVLPTALVSAVATPVGALLGDRAPLSQRTLEYVTHPGTYSIAKAERVLGWRPRTCLDDGMARTQAWLQASGLLD
jgi:nucleoside-diphosphate-sugar epimerase